MRTALKIFASILLLFNSIGAFFGGLHLIIHPDGSSLQMSLDWLQYSPFSDYFIPGIILLISSGLFGIVVFISLVLSLKIYPWLLTAQGAILTGWILVQMIMLREIIWLQILLGSIGLLLMLMGLLLWRMSKSS